MNGNVALIKVDEINQIPRYLADLLSDKTIIKVGIDTEKLKSSLFEDIGLKVKSSFDIRFFAEDVGDFSGYLYGLLRSMNTDYFSKPDPYGRQIESAQESVTALIEIYKELSGMEFTKEFIFPYSYKDLHSKLDVPFCTNYY